MSYTLFALARGTIGCTGGFEGECLRYSVTSLSADLHSADAKGPATCANKRKTYQLVPQRTRSHQNLLESFEFALPNHFSTPMARLAPSSVGHKSHVLSSATKAGGDLRFLPSPLFFSLSPLSAPRSAYPPRRERELSEEFPQCAHPQFLLRAFDATQRNATARALCEAKRSAAVRALCAPPARPSGAAAALCGTSHYSGVRVKKKTEKAAAAEALA